MGSQGYAQTEREFVPCRSTLDRTVGKSLSRYKRAEQQAYSVQPARLELALFDPKVGGDVRIVSLHFPDEPLGVLAADESSSASPRGELRRESVVDYRIDEHVRESVARVARAPKACAGAILDGASSTPTASPQWL